MVPTASRVRNKNDAARNESESPKSSIFHNQTFEQCTRHPSSVRGLAFLELAVIHIIGCWQSFSVKRNVENGICMIMDKSEFYNVSGVGRCFSLLRF
jgi:hypothetical protein